MPTFSIIVPIYNVEKYLNKCIDSILTQSFSDFELILVDDGSPDNCPEICEEYAKKDSRIKVIHKENAGVSAARNTGLNCCNGEFVWLVDSDDYILPDSLKKLVDLFKQDIDIIVFDNLNVDEAGNPERSIEKKSLFIGVAEKKDILNFMKTACTERKLPFSWRNVYRRELLKKNNIRQNEDLRIGEDSIFNLEAYLCAKKILFIDEKFYAYRNVPSSLSRNHSFSMSVLANFELYDWKRDEIYEKYCSCRDEEYYKDAGTFVIKTLYIYALLIRLYQSDSRNDSVCSKKFPNPK